MQGNARNLVRHLRSVILILFVSFFLSSCTAYSPSMYPSYDVLNPGPEVTKNPLAFTEDGNAIVNEAFLLWVYELKEEVKKLRKELGRGTNREEEWIKIR